MSSPAAVRLRQWDSEEKPDESLLRQRMSEEGLSAYKWSNGPFDAYPPHMHRYAKVILVVRGSIEFTVGETGQPFRLKAGDRLDLPAQLLHSALVGPDGVACLEAHL
jgi:quercetin dioxygenase-like cupin family protein